MRPTHALVITDVEQLSFLRRKLGYRLKAGITDTRERRLRFNGEFWDAADESGASEVNADYIVDNGPLYIWREIQ